ncbi:MAG: 30S ribosome-binding factor RbfA [Propionibacteriaceae bacterium]|jgi:ribosome-binding factor A|nr:30S ribosome-binding factor RbfA [Propionibacteriaceae bacterium]
MPSAASFKVAEQIKTIAAQMLQRRIQDPRLGFVTITDARLSKDWHTCELFYTVLGTVEDRAETEAALEAAKGQIRTQVARQLAMRFTPQIVFVADALPDQSRDFEELLAQVKATDAQIAAGASGATYAGDEDPYRKPPVETDDEADEAEFEGSPEVDDEEEPHPGETERELA